MFTSLNKQTMDNNSKVDNNILDLPNEVLVHICSFLPSIDIVVLTEVNQKFSQVCCEKPVVRSLNLKDRHDITESILGKFFLPKLRCDNIRILNLNYCRWLPAEFFTQIPKLRNLKELHVLNCQVDFTKLKEIVSALDLRALSWTWPDDEVSSWNDETVANFGAKFSMLQHLVLHISNMFCITGLGLYYFLNLCANLESFELFLVNTFKKINSHPERDVNSTIRTVELLARPRDNPVKQLRHLKVGALPCFAKLILKNFANPTTSWDTIWLADNGEILRQWWNKGKLTLLQITLANVLNLSNSDVERTFLEFLEFFPRGDENFQREVWKHEYQMQCRELSLNNSAMDAKQLMAVAHQCLHLEKLSMANCTWIADEDGEFRSTNGALKLLTENCIKITHLDMTRAQSEFIEISCLTSLKHLVSLGISPCMLSKMRLVEGQDPNSGSQTEVPVNFPEELLRDTVLWAITEACPNITKLQILIQAKSTTTHTVAEAEYACISRFQKLTHLRIHDFNYNGSGHFFNEVLKNCSGLVSLRIKELGSGCKYINELSGALMHAKSLKNLSIWQGHLNLPVIFFENFEKCSQLERLELSHLETYPDLSLHIKSSVTKLPKLVILFLWMTTSDSEREGLDAALKEFRHDRPSFTHFISTSTENNDASLERPLHIFLDGFQEFE